jgi:hypothetical protein
VVTEEVINWFCGLLLDLWGVEPPGDPMEVLTDIGDGWSSLVALNYFLPIGETMAAVSAVLILGPPMLATTIALWLGVGVIRGGQSRI